MQTSYFFRSMALLALLLFFFPAKSQTTSFNTYSHAEFLSMIENSTDSIFRLDNAIIRYNPSTDSRFGFSMDRATFTRKFSSTDTLIIDKFVLLNNVHFDHSERFQPRAFHHIRFKKDVMLRNTSSVLFIQCTFDGRLDIVSGESMAEAITLLDRNSRMISLSASILESNLKQGITLDMGTADEKTRSQIRVEKSQIWPANGGRGSRISGLGLYSFTVRDNAFIGKGRMNISTDQIDAVDISGNDFGPRVTEIRVLGSEELNTSILEDNHFDNHVLIDFDELTTSSTFQWSQWSKKLVSLQGFNDYFNALPDSSKVNSFQNSQTYDSLLSGYKENSLVEYGKAYKQEVKLRGKLLDLYKAQHDLEDVNTVYIEMKNLETRRLAYLYSQTPSFTTFFKWKVNQFLKVFSDYGTEPSKAIVFSVNVVILFAFVYLFFPNSWDEQGKHRILHRFDFYQKYLRSPSGAHEFYLVERQKELSDYEAFKNRIEDGKLELPKFFISWSRPVYNIAMLSTKISTRFLKSSDFLSGKWQDLSPKQRQWKNMQIGTFLVVGIGYDISIRILNALMLSINAFTTLGFGEIPIKGLPRYLAIIQGFIGWFMLTIFSVSLISQLLN